MSKVGIYSGTFDPVHDGHIAFAETAIQECDLDVLYFLPEESPRRKTNITPHEHRLSMLKLAAKNAKILFDLPGMSHQHDIISTINSFAKHHPNDRLVLLMGADVFMNIDKWKNWQKLIKLADFAVALRTEDDGEELVYKLTEIPNAIVTKIVTDKATVTSSQIRQEIEKGETPKNIDIEVLDYAKKNGLYFA